MQSTGETEPAEQKAMIKPRKCCGGFKILHAIQPRMLPAKNVIAILTGINHLYVTKLVLVPLSYQRTKLQIDILYSAIY